MGRVEWPGLGGLAWAVDCWNIWAGGSVHPGTDCITPRLLIALPCAALQVELCGRPMNIGRPKGYVPPVPGALPLPPQPKAPAPAPVPVAGLPSSTLLLNNILPAGQLRSEEDRKVVSRRAQRSAVRGHACAGGLAPAALACGPTASAVLSCLHSLHMTLPFLRFLVCPALPPSLPNPCSCKRRFRRRPPSGAPSARCTWRRPRRRCRT